MNRPGIAKVRAPAWFGVGLIILAMIFMLAFAAGISHINSTEMEWTRDRRVVRVCPGGDRIYVWRGEHRLRNGDVLGVPPERVC